jgi:hypothetical protein
MARPHHRALLPQVLDDLRTLNKIDDRLVDVALQAIVDLAEHRKTGKLLGARHVSGDLTGCRRLRFDLPEEHPERFRIVYRLLPDDQHPDTLEVIAVGLRGGHTAYQAAAARLTDT